MFASEFIHRNVYDVESINSQYAGLFNLITSKIVDELIAAGEERAKEFSFSLKMPYVMSGGVNEKVPDNRIVHGKQKKRIAFPLTKAIIGLLPIKRCLKKDVTSLEFYVFSSGKSKYSILEDVSSVFLPLYLETNVFPSIIPIRGSLPDLYDYLPQGVKRKIENRGVLLYVAGK